MANGDVDARMLDCHKEQTFSANWNTPGRVRWSCRSLPALSIPWFCDFKSNYRSSLSPLFGVQYSCYRVNKLRWGVEAVRHKGTSQNTSENCCACTERTRAELCATWKQKLCLLNIPAMVFSSILYLFQRLTSKTLFYCKSSILFLQNPKWE